MKVRYISVNGSERHTHTTKSPTYNQLTAFLQGPMERFTLLVDPPDGSGKPKRATMYVNEESGLNGMEVNRTASNLVLRGAELMGTMALQEIRGPVVLTHSD